MTPSPLTTCLLSWLIAACSWMALLTIIALPGQPNLTAAGAVGALAAVASCTYLLVLYRSLSRSRSQGNRENPK